MKTNFKFKVDENLPVEIVDYLRNADYDTMTVIEQKLRGKSDDNIANICKKEGRIIVTLDTDFSDMQTYPPSEYPGIMVIRVNRQSKRHITDVFVQTIPLLKKEPIDKSLWIVEETRVRIRG